MWPVWQCVGATAQSRCSAALAFRRGSSTGLVIGFADCLKEVQIASHRHIQAKVPTQMSIVTQSCCLQTPAQRRTTDACECTQSPAAAIREGSSRLPICRSKTLLQIPTAGQACLFPSAHWASAGAGSSLDIRCPPPRSGRAGRVPQRISARLGPPLRAVGAAPSRSSTTAARSGSTGDKASAATRRHSVVA